MNGNVEKCFQEQDDSSLEGGDLKIISSKRPRMEGIDLIGKDILSIMEPMNGVMDSRGGALETDSSISILEVPWAISIPKSESKTSSVVNSAHKTSYDVFPDFIDPLFLDYYFTVPAVLKGFIEKMSERRFVYRVSEDSVFEVVRSRNDEVVYSLDVFDFEKDDFDGLFRTKIAFVINKNKCRSFVKTEQNNEYRAAIEQGMKYHRKTDMYSKKINELYRMQIHNGMNFIFISEPQDLLGEMKTILRYLSSKKIYIPKTKVFTPAQKTEHLQNFLQSIPGIGKSVAKSLSSRFESIGGLYRYIEKSKDDSMKEFRIWDEEERHSRPLGEKQYSKIKAAFVNSKKDS